MQRCIICYRDPCDCSVPVDLFGSPFLCQKGEPTRKFASPNSLLDQQSLEELRAKIEMANDLLRSLVLEPDDDNKRQLQLHFLKMSGMNVLAEVLCECDMKEHEEEIHLNEETHDKELPNNEKNDCPKVKSIWIQGKLATAGRDFIQLNQNGSTVLIPYEKLLTVKQCPHLDAPELVPEFIDASQKLRRQLAFNFGEFVSKQPDFINLFFGIFLFEQLKQFVGEDILVFTSVGKMSGLLTKVEEGNATLLNKRDEIKVNMDEICYLKVFNLK